LPYAGCHSLADSLVLRPRADALELVSGWQAQPLYARDLKQAPEMRRIEKVSINDQAPAEARSIRRQ
jgi:hypothetical protein